MPRFTQIFGRLGNKTNDLKYFKHLVPLDAKIIVEPFCGTCSLSLNLFSDHDKYEYHFNDLDKHIYDILCDPQAHNDFKQEMMNKYNNMKNGLEHEVTYVNINKLFVDEVKKKDSPFAKHFLDSFVVRGYIIKQPTINSNPNHFSIYQKATKTNEDYKTTMEL